VELLVTGSLWPNQVQLRVIFGNRPEDLDRVNPSRVMTSTAMLTTARSRLTAYAPPDGRINHEPLNTPAGHPPDIGIAAGSGPIRS
jgi:hypothetical protein